MAARGRQGPTLQGPESLRGERPFLFLRKKKRSFTPKKKKGPVYGAFLLGKRRLAALRTVVRTTPGRYGHPMVEQGKEVVLSNCRLAVPLSRQSAAAAWRGHRASHNSPLPHRRREAPDHPGPERGSRRRRMVRASACPCSPRAGRNGRKGSFLSYESRKPPFSTPNLP